MICILQKHVSPAGLLSLFFFFKPKLFLENFILFLLQAVFPVITPVPHAE